MAITVGGTSITFNDGTTQSTAASASSYIGGRGQVFTANGTFTIPTGVSALKVTVVGGGGGGGGTNVNSYGGNGGGAGGTAIKLLTGLTPGNTLSVTVGSGGAGATGAGSAGNGGNSSVASGTQTITTITGNGGISGTNSTSTGAGGTATNGDINVSGSSGSFANTWSIPVGCGYIITQSGIGGLSLFGKSALGRASTGYGAGGAGAHPQFNPYNGFAATAGIVIFEW